jgi:hypothetical protein
MDLLERLILEHAKMLENPLWSKDNPAKQIYYGLLNKVLDRSAMGISGQLYTIRGVGFHPDQAGRFRPDFCEGFIRTNEGIVHLHNLQLDTEKGMGYGYQNGNRMV